MNTFPSKEQEAKIDPKEGCAHDKPWIGPSCLEERREEEGKVRHVVEDSSSFFDLFSLDSDKKD